MLISSENYAYVIDRRIHPKHLKLFIMAVYKLGAVDKSENSATDLRLDGIYNLKRIENESDNDYWPILEILTFT
jgi:hypothetical protein